MAGKASIIHLRVRSQGSESRSAPFLSAIILYTHLGRLNYRDDRSFRRAGPQHTSESRCAAEGSG